jgi:hypothetical protein
MESGVDFIAVGDADFVPHAGYIDDLLGASPSCSSWPLSSATATTTVSRRRASRVDATTVHDGLLLPELPRFPPRRNGRGSHQWQRHCAAATVRSVARPREGFRVGVEFRLEPARRDCLAGIYAKAIFESAPWAAFYGRIPSSGPLRIGADQHRSAAVSRRAA